jgi:hypothetical protein
MWRKWMYLLKKWNKKGAQTQPIQLKPLWVKPISMGKLFISVNDAGVSFLPGINYCIFYDTGNYYLSWIFHQYHNMTPAINLSTLTTSLFNCQYQWHRPQFIAWNNNTCDYIFFSDVNYTLYTVHWQLNCWKNISLSTPWICYGKI